MHTQSYAPERFSEPGRVEYLVEGSTAPQEVGTYLAARTSGTSCIRSFCLEIRNIMFTENQGQRDGSEPATVYYNNISKNFYSGFIEIVP